LVFKVEPDENARRELTTGTCNKCFLDLKNYAMYRNKRA
jgi:hypothetical protein